MSIVARRHDANRRELAPVQPPAAEQSVSMLPVAIVPPASEPRLRGRRSGTIDIALACGARGEVPSETLRQVIELLR